MNSKATTVYTVLEMAPSSSTDSSCCSNTRKYLCVALLISIARILAAAKVSRPILLPQLDIFHLPSSSCSAAVPKLNFRPIIGILSHPGDGASGRLNNSSSVSYIAASYVKFVESAGARVVPLIYNEPRDVLYKKLQLVNGLLFTGGWAKNGLYYETVEALFKKVLERNDEEDHFPLLAICLGFELVTMIVGKDREILESFNASYATSNLLFNEEPTSRGSVFERFPPDLLARLSTDCLVMQNHRYGISPQRLCGNHYLCSFFKILSTSTDRDSKVYVSTVQGRHYPVTGLQWHPEKHAFEWGLSMIPHSEDAVELTQNVANFFIRESRKSSNRPPIRQVLANLIYNYPPTYCGRDGKGYDEVYIF